MPFPLVASIVKFFRPPPSEASRLDAHTALAGLLLETCYRDGGLTGHDRKLIDEALVSHLDLPLGEASTLRVRAEEVQWNSLSPIGFMTASAKGLDENQREDVIRTMIRFIERDRSIEAMENRLIMSTANCFGIKSGQVEQLRRQVRAQTPPDDTPAQADRPSDGD